MIRLRLLPIILLAAALGCPGHAQQAAGDDQTGIKVQADGSLTLDLREVDIRAFVDLVAKLQGLVAVMGDDVKGKVTVYAPRPLDLDHANKVLMAMLDVRGFTVIRTDSLLKVVHKSDAVHESVAVSHGFEAKDVPDVDQVITQVVPVTHSQPKTMLEHIRPLISPTGNAFAADEASCLVITDSGANVRRMLEVAQYLDKAAPPTVHDEETVVYPIRYLKAKDMADALSKAFASKDGGGGSGDGTQKAAAELRVTPVEAANSLIVTAPERQQQAIAGALKQLDCRRLQVLIEVKIAEATFTDEESVSNILSQGEYIFGKGATLNVVAGSQLNSPLLTATFKSAHVDAILQAMATNDRIHILSQPRLMTSDNEAAKIIVGKEQPILKSVTDLGTDGTGDGKTVSDYVYKDIGIELDVTPHINVDRDVALDVSFQYTSILSEVVFPGAVNAPVLGKRQAKTTVTVMDDTTLVIGGLISSNQRQERSGVPVLRDIPVIGRLFSSKTDHEERTELLVFITPRVVDSAAEGLLLSREEAAGTPRLPPALITTPPLLSPPKTKENGK